MKQLLYTLSLLFLLTGCNMFIDDDEMDTPQDVPVHEGEGYDAPLTVKDGECTVTYQYNSDVRLLSPDDQQYIVSAESDPTGAFIEIHYRTDTPDRLLPVPGEILVSSVTDRFPWGCNHRVQHRVNEDGVIKYVATFAQLDETYKELDIDGTMTTRENEEFYVDAVVEEDIPATDSTQAATRRTLVRYAPSAEEKALNVILADDKFGFDLHFAVGISSEENTGNVGFSYGASFPYDDNYCKTEVTFDFTNFSISGGQFLAKVHQTIEESVLIKVAGNAKISKTKTWRPLKGKAFTIGPVVIVLFVNINLHADVNVAVSAQFSSYKKTINHYDINFVDGKVSRTVENVADTGMKFPEFVFEGSVSIGLEFQIGLGIYGKIISVRIIPDLTLSFGAQTPRFVTMANGHKAFDLTTRAGPEWRLELSLKLGVYIDLSLSNIIKAYKDLGSEARKKMLKDLEEEAKKSSEYYEQLAKGDYSNYDPNRKGQYDYKDGEGDEESISVTFGPWPLWKKSYTWYPRIDDNSLRVERLWDADTQTMRFVAEYKVNDAGILSDLFNNWFIPGLCINDHGRQTFVYSAENSNAIRLQKDRVYHFEIPAHSEETTYDIAPCYYELGKSKELPAAVDKSLKVNVTTPSCLLYDITPVDCKREAFSYLDQNQGYRYKWTFYFYTTLKVKGYDNMDAFGVREMSGSMHQYTPKTDKDRRDGTYQLNWQAVHRSDNSTDAGMLVSLQSFHIVKGQTIYGDTWLSLGMQSDRTYSTSGGSFPKEGTYAPRLSSWTTPKPATELRLLSVVPLQEKRK